MIKSFFKNEYLTVFLILFSLIATLCNPITAALKMSGHMDYTLITNIFPHSDLTHWSNNMLFIALLGPSIERRYGIIRTSCFILLTTIIISLIYKVQHISGIGMSGICFAFATLNCFSKDTKFISFSCIIVIILMVYPEITKIFNNDNIGHSAHVLGAVIGIILGIINNKIEYIVNNNSPY